MRSSEIAQMAHTVDRPVRCRISHRILEFGGQADGGRLGMPFKVFGREYLPAAFLALFVRFQCGPAGQVTLNFIRSARTASADRSESSRGSWSFRTSFHCLLTGARRILRSLVLRPRPIRIASRDVPECLGRRGRLIGERLGSRRQCPDQQAW